MDLKAYRPQIKELIPLRNSPDFNELLNNILFGESTSDKFLIKMELSRLCKPCQRIVDLRDRTTEPCELFEQDRLKHYLTKETIKVLDSNIQLYGLYTVGVFEAVHEYVAEKKEKQQQQKLQKQLDISKPIKKEQCEFLALSQKNKRGAPRMFFVSEISLTTSYGEKFIAQTSNISATGLKLKIKEEISLGDDSLLTVMYTGLALEYNDEFLRSPITYRLVKQENNIDSDGSSYLYLNYHAENNKEIKNFTAFISNFIRINQFKYKIDVHYYYELAKIRALKNSYLSQMSTLPLCVDANAASPFLFALESNTNSQLVKDFRTHEKDQLPQLFNKRRLSALIGKIKGRASTTIYTFIHEVKDKQYFLSATEDELVEKGLKQLFIHYGRSKLNWHTYHLTLTPFQYQPTSSADVTESAPDIFEKITHLITLQRLAYKSPFKTDSSLDSTDVTQLNQFIHRATNEVEPAPIFSLFSTELRKEERYQYKSGVTVADKRSLYTGHIVDFSFSGLKVKLDKISVFSTSEIVTVNLVELQKLSKAHTITGLHYKIVRKSANNMLHLQVCDQETLNISQAFFYGLVKNNAKHFTCQPLHGKKQPLQKQLIEIAEESFNNVIFFVNKDHIAPKIEYSAIDLKGHPLQTLFSLHSDNRFELNYYPIANNQIYERLVIAPLRETIDKSLTKEALIYVKAIKNKKNGWEISSFLDEDFRTEKEKITFIKESQLNAKFYAFNFRLSILPLIDQDCIKSEVHAISRFAIHLTKKLEEELLSIRAMIEITDRTSHIIHAANAD